MPCVRGKCRISCSPFLIFLTRDVGPTVFVLRLISIDLVSVGKHGDPLVCRSGSSEALYGVRAWEASQQL